jgi:hypothetical protein
VGLLQSLIIENEKQIIKKEGPKVILIMEKSGITLFSCQFELGNQIEDQLISGFLTAINAFGNEIFNVTGTLDQISYNEFNIIMRSIEEFTFCYIFKNQNSFVQVKKLETFISRLRKVDSIWNRLYEAAHQKVRFQTHDSEFMERIIYEIFQPTTSFSFS